MPEPSLAYRTVSFSIMTAHDGGSKADANLQVWRPDLPDGWCYLGQSWSSNDTAPHAVIVRALEPDALVDVASWECVWTDTGSGKSWNFALWRGIPPSDNYVVAGGIFIRTVKSGGYPAPSWILTNGLKAIRKDLVVTDTPTWVWDDNGVGANSGGSVWRTTGASGVFPNVIIPVKGHGQASQDVCFSLNRSKVLAM
ncbi:FDS protein [Mucidula mucida]|nr:FDS protein [Mucidula mucida]